MFNMVCLILLQNETGKTKLTVSNWPFEAIRCRS
jgi:hypothetical protein